MTRRWTRWGNPATHRFTMYDVDVYQVYVALTPTDGDAGYIIFRWGDEPHESATMHKREMSWELLINSGKSTEVRRALIAAVRILL